MQSTPQLMPAGEDVTPPPPVPVFITISVSVCSVNVAVIVTGAPMVSMQVPVPLHPPPDQPVNVEPVAGAALNVTAVPFVKFSLQSTPQLMPAGTDVMVPAPLPAFVTLSAFVPRSQFATAVFAASTVTSQVPVPL